MSTLKEVSKIRDETKNLFYNSKMPNRALLKDVSFVITIYENSDEQYKGKLINSISNCLKTSIYEYSIRIVDIIRVSNNVPTKECF